jgi:Ca2+-binding EF-hand superfamily protein
MSRPVVRALAITAALAVIASLCAWLFWPKNSGTFADVHERIQAPAQHATTESATSTVRSDAVNDSANSIDASKNEQSASSTATLETSSLRPAVDAVPDSPPSTAKQADVTQPAPATPTSVERIILLAPQNPLIIEFQLTIDDQPHTAAMEKLVAEVLKLADIDGDGRTTWSELCASPRIKYGQFGNLAIDGENGEKQITERYDINRDKIVDESELPRFLTRNAGSARPFSIRGSLDQQGLNRRSAATWRVLDADDDGVLSAEELAAAPARLAARDTDDDEILVISDLDRRLQTPDPEMNMNERRRRGPDAARLLGPYADWAAVQLSLENAYGGSRVLRAGCFPLTPELFTHLDKNGDGRLQRDEYRRLNDAPPDLVISVAFGSAAQETGDRGQETQTDADSREGEAPAEPKAPNQPRLQVIYVSSNLSPTPSSPVMQPGRLTMPIGGVLLTFYTNDTVANESFAARAKQALAMFDANKDGYLEKSEIPESLQAQLGRFEAIDRDEDGKVFPAEIEAFLRQQQSGLRAQIHAKATDGDDVLFAALDSDHDQRLDGREVQSSAARLASLDQNGDGQLSPEELPEIMTIGLARGSLENADALFVPPPVIVRTPNREAPRWFSAMDANGDGVISRREFLGPSEKFAELDVDANGLLELKEIPNREPPVNGQ